MNTNANIERTRTKRRFCQFTKTVSVLDHGVDRKLAERKRQCQRYEARHGTCGKRAVFL